MSCARRWGPPSTSSTKRSATSLASIGWNAQPNGQHPAGQHELEEQRVELGGPLDGQGTEAALDGLLGCPLGPVVDEGVPVDAHDRHVDQVRLGVADGCEQVPSPADLDLFCHRGLLAAWTTASTPATASARPSPVRMSPRIHRGALDDRRAPRVARALGPRGPWPPAGRPPGCPAPRSPRSPAPQPPRGTLEAVTQPGRERARTRQTERWFINQGLPHLIDDYRRHHRRVDPGGALPLPGLRGRGVPALDEEREGTDELLPVPRRPRHPHRGPHGGEPLPRPEALGTPRRHRIGTPELAVFVLVPPLLPAIFHDDAHRLARGHCVQPAARGRGVRGHQLRAHPDDPMGDRPDDPPVPPTSPTSPGGRCRCCCSSPRSCS